MFDRVWSNITPYVMNFYDNDHGICLYSFQHLKFTYHFVITYL